MSHLAIVVSLFAVTCVASALLVRQTIDVARRIGLLAVPTARGVHISAVPRVGGIPVLVAILVGLAVSFSFDVVRFPSEVGRLFLLSAGAALIVLLMLVDDVAGLSARTKLGIQVLVAGLMAFPRVRGSLHGLSIDQFNLPVTGQVSLPVAIAVPVTIGWFVVLMNTMNWADGIDGLAGSLTLVAALVLFLHTYFWPRDNPQFTISILPVVLGAAVLGFLPFNWHPSRIMLGDSGANLLGLLIAGIAIIGGAKLAAALLVLGLPLFDAMYVVARRLITGQPIAQADMTHLHHRLLRRGWNQSQVVLAVSGVSFGFGMLAIILPNREAKLMALVLLAGLLLLSAGQLRSDIESSRRQQSVRN
jgi:UDP-N-acetylmuramyl pentapeptide phosphotransferase/UDP-N-acetylglucosamine-1-phosphate transferase